MSNDLNVTQTDLPGVVLLEPTQYGNSDPRGPFFESWNRDKMRAHGLKYDFVQDNQSLSYPKHTLRGLHLQAPPFGQTKLVRCVVGAIFDVAVDIRTGSPTYGAWVGFELSAENRRQLLVPEGFAHGFVTLQENCIVNYKCTDLYAPQHEAALRWDSCGIDWPFEGDPVINDKDADAPTLAAFDSPFTWGQV